MRRIRTGAASQTCIERIIPANSLSTSDAAALRFAFVKHLAHVNDKDEVVRLTARWDALPKAAKPILDKFVNERLIIRSENKNDGKSGRPWVSIEVDHEAMFRCWSDLKDGFALRLTSSVGVESRCAARSKRTTASGTICGLRNSPLPVIGR